jgi:S1-C subfamily serine protease
MREASFAEAGHPSLTLEANPALAGLWTATCRVGTSDGVGSGFFVDGRDEGPVVVTNAHVAHSSGNEICIEFLNRGRIERWTAYVIAIDYPHDLAILKCDEQGWLPVLTLAPAPPRPGDDVWICGYPLGVETPRLARALISGYDVYINTIADGFRTPSIVIDGSVNFGNSGGPIYDPNGGVVGVVCAQRVQELHNVDSLPQAERDTLALHNRHLPRGTGIGYALDPADVQRLLAALNTLPDAVRVPHRKYEPKLVSMHRADFVALQVAALSLERKPEGSSAIGPFSFTEDGQYYLGWSDNRVPLPKNVAWSSIAAAISRSGGSFFLRGYDVHLYRIKYKGYIGPVHINLID